MNFILPGVDVKMTVARFVDWNTEPDTTPTPRDVCFMAEVLEGRHGVHAAGVADFFAAYHGEKGDAGRAWAWSGVAELVRNRERERLERT